MVLIQFFVVWLVADSESDVVQQLSSFSASVLKPWQIHVPTHVEIKIIQSDLFSALLQVIILSYPPGLSSHGMFHMEGREDG